MATALLANSPTGEEVVLKIPHQGTTDAFDRVRDEARIGIRLSHPNVVETLDLFEHDGKPVLVVRYVEGCSLREAWQGGPLHPAAVCRVGAQIADALHAIHDATDEHGRPLNILHRDVAPGNVLLTIDGDAQLIDLGIARSAESQASRTAIGVIKGTLRYLSPEIVEGKGHTAGGDMWALGVCLWEAALGRRAVRGDERVTLAAIVRGQIATLLPGEHLEPRLEALLRKLLGPEAERPDAAALTRTCGELEEALGGGTDALRAHVQKLPRGDNLGESVSLEGTVLGENDDDKPTVETPSPPRPSPESATPTVQLPAVVVGAVIGQPKETSGPVPRAITFCAMPSTDPGVPSHEALVREDELTVQPLAGHTPERAPASPTGTTPVLAPKRGTWLPLAVGGALALAVVAALTLWLR